jgi:hypothetical protein
MTSRRTRAAASWNINRSFAIYREWHARTRSVPGPNNQRRPQWLLCLCRPAPRAYEFREARNDAAS